MKGLRVLLVVVVVLVLLGAVGVRGAGHTLYLKYDADSNFPEFGDNGHKTSPLQTFDASQLDSSFGATETEQIKTKVLWIVQEDFREFDLEVTTTQPSGSGYQTLGIDHKVSKTSSGWLLGKAKGIDNEADDDDYARVFGGSFGDWDSAWQGSNSTVDRWSRAIGETAAHEAGHNYGVRHPNSALNSAESSAGDSRSNHILATYSAGLTAEERATINRHFSDTSYGILAANLGLNSRTLTNWAFRNPNDVKAHDFHINFLSQYSVLTVESELSRDPFDSYVVNRLGEQTIDNEKWYEYEVAWSGGNGVEAGALWYSGIKLGGFIGLSPELEPTQLPPTAWPSGDFIITDTYLTDIDSNRLPLRPRTISYGGGDTDDDGIYSTSVSNDSDELMIVRNLRYRLVPRMIDPETMVAESLNDPAAAGGVVVNVLMDIEIPGETVLGPGQKASFVLGNLNDWLNARLDTGGGSADDGVPDDEAYIAPAIWRDMFPSTYIYGTATVVVPDQQVWDADSEQFIITDIKTEVFFQLGGLPVTIPEPVTMGLLLVGSLVLLRRGRQ